MGRGGGVPGARDMDELECGGSGSELRDRGYHSTGECAGMGVQRSRNRVHSGAGSDSWRGEGGLCATDPQCAGYTGVECAQGIFGQDAAGVFFGRFAGSKSAGATGALCRSESGMTMTGISGVAAVRAAEAMLQTLGGTEVVLLFAAAGLPGDPAGELGLVDPGVEQAAISPVIVKGLTTGDSGPGRRIESLEGGASVAGQG